MSSQESYGSSMADVIASRLERLGRARSWDSPGTVSQFAALEAAGFTPAGQVVGTTVLQLGADDKRPRCTGSWTFTPRSDLASAGGPLSALLRRLNGARRRALERAVADCTALGADGIVGARLVMTTLASGVLEFTVTGTAVRARSAIRPGVPFTAHVSGPELVRLLDAGWMPFSVVFSIAIATRHEGMDTKRQARGRWGTAGNQEIRSYSHVVTDVRRDVRRQLGEAVQELGGEGIVVDEMTLTVSERECPTHERQHDHVAQAAIHGTALVSFTPTRRAGPRPALTVMRLNPASHPGFFPAEAGTPIRSFVGEPARPELAIPEPRLSSRLVARGAAWRRKHDVFNNDYQNRNVDD